MIIHSKLKLSIIFLFFIVYCNDSNPTNQPNVVPKGDRLLGMDVLDTTPSYNFTQGIIKAKSAGVQFITFPVLWNQINDTGTNYNATWVNNIKAMATACFTNNLKLSLTFWTVDVTGKHLPADLMTTRFNNSSMSDRFIALLDNLFITEGIDYSLLTSIQIGNEIDAYNTSGDPDFSWSDYGAFLFNIKVAILSKSYSSLRIGFTGTLYGLNDNTVTFTAIANAVDFIGVTYYPQNINFTVKDTSVVSEDISALVSNFSSTGKPIWLQEAGYQTGALCNSSEIKQAQFIQNIFKSWDTYSANIKSASFLRLNDLTPADATAIAAQYGLAGNSEFIEYIRTLGLVNYDGTEKQAFQTLYDNAHARGW